MAEPEAVGDAAAPKPTVFVSYASADLEAAMLLGDALRVEGSLSMWSDGFSGKPGRYTGDGHAGSGFC